MHLGIQCCSIINNNKVLLAWSEGVSRPHHVTGKGLSTSKRSSGEKSYAVVQWQRKVVGCQQKKPSALIVLDNQVRTLATRSALLQSCQRSSKRRVLLSVRQYTPGLKNLGLSHQYDRSRRSRFWRTPVHWSSRVSSCINLDFQPLLIECCAISKTWTYRNQLGTTCTFATSHSAASFSVEIYAAPTKCHSSSTHCICEQTQILSGIGSGTTSVWRTREPVL